MKLYVDEHVPRAITRGLRAAGIDVLTVQDDGHAQTADTVIFQRAIQLGRVIVTSDRDYLVEAAVRQGDGRWFAGLLHLKARTPVGRAIEDIAFLARTATSGELDNRVVHIPLR